MAGTLIGRGGSEAQPVVGAGLTREQTDLNHHQIIDIMLAEMSRLIVADAIVSRIDELDQGGTEEDILLIVRVAHQNSLLDALWKSSGSSGLQDSFCQPSEE